MPDDNLVIQSRTSSTAIIPVALAVLLYFVDLSMGFQGIPLESWRNFFPLIQPLLRTLLSLTIGVTVFIALAYTRKFDPKRIFLISLTVFVALSICFFGGVKTIPHLILFIMIVFLLKDNMPMEGKLVIIMIGIILDFAFFGVLNLWLSNMSYNTLRYVFPIYGIYTLARAIDYESVPWLKTFYIIGLFLIIIAMAIYTTNKVTIYSQMKTMDPELIKLGVQGYVEKTVGQISELISNIVSGLNPNTWNNQQTETYPITILTKSYNKFDYGEEARVRYGITVDDKFKDSVTFIPNCVAKKTSAGNELVSTKLSNLINGKPGKSQFNTRYDTDLYCSFTGLDSGAYDATMTLSSKQNFDASKEVYLMCGDTFNQYIVSNELDSLNRNQKKGQEDQIKSIKLSILEKFGYTIKSAQITPKNILRGDVKVENDLLVVKCPNSNSDSGSDSFTLTMTLRNVISADGSIVDISDIRLEIPSGLRLTSCEKYDIDGFSKNNGFNEYLLKQIKKRDDTNEVTQESFELVCYLEPDSEFLTKEGGFGDITSSSVHLLGEYTLSISTTDPVTVNAPAKGETAQTQPVSYTPTSSETNNQQDTTNNVCCEVNFTDTRNNIKEKQTRDSCSNAIKLSKMEDGFKTGTILPLEQCPAQNQVGNQV